MSFWYVELMRGVKYQPGTTIGYLTLVEVIGNNPKSKERIWKCKCVCGNETNKITREITRKDRKPSCGCKTLDSRWKNDPKIISIKNIYRSYFHMAKKRKLSFKLTFEKFQELIFSNCHYCNCEPSRLFNSQLFGGKYRTSNIKRINEGSIFCNGVDRKNNNDGYEILNVVPCCWICNRGKKEYGYEDFVERLKNIARGIKNVEEENSYMFSKLEERALIRTFQMYSYSAKRSGRDFSINFNKFLKLVLNKCFYCDSKPDRKVKNTSLLRNGVDRIDNKKGYTETNSVSCCYCCNFAKSNLSIEEFNIWLERIKNKWPQE